MQLPARLYDCWRRLAGRYTIDDPRPIAERAPYTYFLPGENELLALAPGDLVQLIFRSHPPGREWDAERMWVTITKADSDALEGRLDNEPSDLPQLKPGTRIAFKRSDAIDIIWAENRQTPPPPPAPRRSYWERCIVDPCVRLGLSRVEYLYRELPELADPDDEYPDSGWRIRGSEDGIADDEQAGRSPEYVALGTVLNEDDAWLHLIDEPIGVRYLRDPITGKFNPDADAG
jgi:hypothetical protein